MNPIQIEPISPANLDCVVKLLQERNDTLPAYTRWKYGQDRNGGFRGVVACQNGEPVGCFGLVARDLLLPEGKTIRCGWFADWYVTQEARTTGVGTGMLHALSAGYPLIFGHPAPDKARAICLANGYHPIGFQSRRRLVLRWWAYEHVRTRLFAKAAVNALIDWQRSAKAQMLAQSPYSNGDSNAGGTRPVALFSNAEEQAEWILSQPVRPGISRRNGVWQTAGLKVIYVDDCFPSQDLRRRILMTAGPRQFSVEAWKQFIQESREAGCVYIESFTTRRSLDRVWAACGAWRYPEPPVLLYGEPDLTNKLFLHGWDRENWTYLAGGSSNGQHH